MGHSFGLFTEASHWCEIQFQVQRALCIHDKFKYRYRYALRFSIGTFKVDSVEYRGKGRSSVTIDTKLQLQIVPTESSHRLTLARNVARTVTWHDGNGGNGGIMAFNDCQFQGIKFAQS